MSAVQTLNLPPITPAAVVLMIVFGVPLVVLCCYFVYMYGVLEREDKQKENSHD